MVGDSTNGTDFFRGGVSKIEIYRRPNAPSSAATQVYFSIFDYGLYRSTASSGFEQVFASAGGGDVATSLDSRTEFALAPMGNKLRVYLGDVGAAPADFYRTDNANVGRRSADHGRQQRRLDQAVERRRPGHMGFSSYNFCEGQCSYDMFVGSPAGTDPTSSGSAASMNYDEIFTSTPPSNGRAVMRSTNAGVLFRDMTNDYQYAGAARYASGSARDRVYPGGARHCHHRLGRWRRAHQRRFRQCLGRLREPRHHVAST